MNTLATFQKDFARALMAPHDSAAPESMRALTAQPGFAVYRNTIMKACIDTLRANYPAVARLVGDEWFRAAAAIYAHESPPQDSRLLEYGSSFSDFLARFAPAQALLYLPDVARLDRLWIEAHTARDEPTVDPATIVNLTPENLAATVLHPHASARWAWFPHTPAFSIWARNRDSHIANNEPWQPEWKAEGALITRPHGAVQWIALDAAGYAFLEQCAAGALLAQAANAALAAQDNADLQHMLAAMLRAGAFARISITAPDQSR